MQEKKAAQKPAQAVAFTTLHAGVSGLLRREESKSKETDDALAESFKGINRLA